MAVKARTGEAGGVRSAQVHRKKLAVEEKTALLKKYGVALVKYKKSVEKYEKLVRRYQEDFASRSSAMMLAMNALRASGNGLALFRRDRFLTRNGRWVELGNRKACWGVTEQSDGGAPSRRLSEQPLEEVVGSMARGLAASEDGSPVMRTLLFTQDDDALAVEVRLERVETSGKRFIIVTGEDVTARIRGEREMARAREAVLTHERMRLLGELASGVAHDLNNTLHALSLRLGHLAATPLDEKQRENVDVLARICEDAAQRVSRLQDLARRREDVPTESFDLATVIREALAVAKPEIEERGHVTGARFDLETDLATEVRAVGSPAELRHVFVNLLLNARDAMPEGGRIRTTSRVDDGRAVVTVEDQGMGIPPEHLGRIFDPFFTTKGQHGMGLGLAVVQGVMRRIGGQIVAANRSDGGAVFTLTFPLVREEDLEPAPDASRTMTSGHRLLVVDDDVDNLEATKYVLEDLGQDVDLASSGQEALELVGNGRRYDLVFCDVGMPGMNGWQVAESIKRAAPGTPVLLLTGWAQEIGPDDPKRRGVDGVIGKPLDLNRLRRLLSERLGEPAQAR